MQLLATVLSIITLLPATAWLLRKCEMHEVRRMLLLLLPQVLACYCLPHLACYCYCYCYCNSFGLPLELLPQV